MQFQSMPVFTLMLAVLYLLTGCIESKSSVSTSGIFSDTPVSGGGSDAIRINRLAVDKPRQTRIYQVSPNENFRVGWDVEYGASPSLVLFLSPTRSAIHPDAVRLYQCNERVFSGDCRQSVVCRYDNQNRIACNAGKGVSTSRGQQISDWINQDVYLVFRLQSLQRSLVQVRTRVEGIRLN